MRDPREEQEVNMHRANLAKGLTLCQHCDTYFTSYDGEFLCSECWDFKIKND